MTLTHGGVFHQVPDTTGACAGAKSATDAAVRVDHIFEDHPFQGLAADGRLRAHGHTDAAIPTGTAGGALGAALVHIFVRYYFLSSLNCFNFAQSYYFFGSFYL